jgi:dCMP deaminase
VILFTYGFSVDVDKKREDYLEWPDYFMAVAFLSAMRSKDPVSQVGACIVNKENRIVGVGYNGMPIGCSDDHLPWSKTSENRLETKYMYGESSISFSWNE